MIMSLLSCHRSYHSNRTWAGGRQIYMSISRRERVISRCFMSTRVFSLTAEKAPNSVPRRPGARRRSVADLEEHRIGRDGYLWSARGGLKEGRRPPPG